MKAIYTIVNDRKTFLGKHIDDKIIREFSFRTAVLWNGRFLSFDNKLMGYAKDNKIKKFIFIDPVKRTTLSIGIRAAQNNGNLQNHGNQGKQWYIPKDIMKKVDFFRTPYVSKEVVL
tara:strand:- start:2324 stop:2674 length:351 start_codon:yes stop_codon:yes gene_type:complete